MEAWTIFTCKKLETATTVEQALEGENYLTGMLDDGVSGITL